MVEFVLSFIAFFLFVYGLLVVCLWGIAAEFTQQAAHEAVQEYAKSMDASEAVNRAKAVLGRWGYVFVEPESLSVKISRNGDVVTARVSAVPRVRKLYLYSMPKIDKISSCVLEYRFRRPDLFAW